MFEIEIFVMKLNLILIKSFEWEGFRFKSVTSNSAVDNGTQKSNKINRWLK